MLLLRCLDFCAQSLGGDGGIPDVLPLRKMWENRGTIFGGPFKGILC